MFLRLIAFYIVAKLKCNTQISMNVLKVWMAVHRHAQMKLEDSCVHVVLGIV